MNKSRLEAFSDGVIAIIITIMVLEIKTPHSAEWKDLLPLYPVVLSYIISFVYVGIYWGNHHHLLHTVKKVTPGMIWANMHLLFWLSLIPFATAWMGENHFAPHTIIVYAVLLMLCGAAFAILQQAIMKSNPFSANMLLVLERLRRKAIISIALYLLAIPMAFVNVAVSGGLFVLVAIIWFIPDPNIARALEE
ncbi:TMEM175 family protein [Chitinophaga sp.]|uniref:TMEM175 family protein n=1 Tax=Chitinophaga sp. TaxID=1869181 RepID=UPI002F9418F6